MNEDAWDMYSIYDRSAKWTGELSPKPLYWMHQLGSLGEERMLDPDVFAAQANAALEER